MNTKHRFKKIMVLGEWEPEFHNQELSLTAACDRYATQAKRAGVTALQINFLTTPYHPLAFLYPDEYYLYFCNYAANLDLFVESDFGRGIYPRFYLEENLHRMQALAAAAKRHGLTAAVYLAEPRCVHPLMLERYPRWRGPRVDHPGASKNPLYALDTDLPQVQEHYRQMMTKLVKAVPNLEDAIIFSHDSGAGFSHSWSLYAGPNGPYYNNRFFGRESNIGKRVVDFCGVLRQGALDAGAVNFDITLTSQFSQPEREEIQHAATEGVHISVWGRESRTGGLEDQWALYQVGASRLKEIGYENAREERVKDFEQRVQVTIESGRKPRLVQPSPNEHYFRLQYVANPWEQLENLDRATNWGVDELLLKGLVTSDIDIPYNINQAAFAAYVADSSLSPEEAVRQVVSNWVPPAAMEPMMAGFRAMEQAVRYRPNFNAYAENDANFLPGPLVPDPSQLTRKEKEPYWLPTHDTLCEIKGEYYYIPNHPREHLDFVFSQFDTSTFPQIEKALASFAEAGANDGGDCAQLQIRHARLYRCLQRSLFHHAQMASYWRNVTNLSVPTPAAIVEAEIANTRDWIEALGERPETGVRLIAEAGNPNGYSRHLVEQLCKRLELMLAHQQDAPRIFDAPLFRDLYTETE
jgi:hypothetical protein